MTLSATAAPDMFSWPPRVVIDAVSTLGGQRSVSVTRLHSDGSAWPVLADTHRLSGGAASVLDYHCPAMDPVSYRVETSSEVATSGPVVFPLNQVWLMSPTDPTLSLAAAYAPDDLFEAEQIDTSAGISDIVGSDQAVAITDETVRTTSTLRLAFLAEQVPAIRKLLRSGGPLLFNAPKRPGWDVRWRWIQRTGSTINNPDVITGKGPAGYPYRILTLPYVWCRQPVNSVQSAWDYTSLAAQWDSYDAVGDAYLSSRDLALDERA